MGVPLLSAPNVLRAVESGDKRVFYTDFIHSGWRKESRRQARVYGDSTPRKTHMRGSWQGAGELSTYPQSLLSLRIYIYLYQTG